MLRDSAHTPDGAEPRGFAEFSWRNWILLYQCTTELQNYVFYFNNQQEVLSAYGNLPLP